MSNICHHPTVHTHLYVQYSACCSNKNISLNLVYVNLCRESQHLVYFWNYRHLFLIEWKKEKSVKRALLNFRFGKNGQPLCETIFECLFEHPISVDSIISISSSSPTSSHNKLNTLLNHLFSISFFIRPSRCPALLAHACSPSPSAYIFLSVCTQSTQWTGRAILVDHLI